MTITKKRKKKKLRKRRRVIDSMAKKTTKKKTTKKAKKKKTKKVTKKDIEEDEDFIIDDEEEVQSIAEDTDIDDEEDSPEFERKDQLTDVSKQILKKFGKGTVILASDNDSMDIARWSTGIMCLDHVLGGGRSEETGRMTYGLPRGFFTSFYGGESDGKTTTALITAGAVQKSCRFCSTRITKKNGCACGQNVPCVVAWWDAEGCFDRDWAQRMGIDLRALHLIRTKTAEDGVDITRILLDSGEIDLLVIDSIACLTPKAEMVEAMDKAMMGTAARLVNRAIRIWTGLLNKPERSYNQQPAIIMINQIRMKLGVMWGSPETRPGGRGQFYAEGIALRFGKGKYHFLNDDGSKEIAMSNAQDDDAPAWRDIKFTSTKNKTGTAPRLSGIYHLHLDDRTWLEHDYRRGDRSEIEPLWGYGVKRGVIVKDGRLWRCGKLSSTTRDGLKQKLSGSPRARGRLKREILGKLLG